MELRDKYARLSELRDSMPSTGSAGACFPALDDTVTLYPPKARFLSDIELELSGLDAAAWTALKEKVRALRLHPTRILQPLYDTLNEAKGYNHLVRAGCNGIHFIPATEKTRTPDLGAVAVCGERLVCEVKTINISDVEVERRSTGCVGRSSDSLDDKFSESSDPI